MTDAGGQPVPKGKVDLYAGVGGNSTGQYGRFVELVAVAYDNGGARHVRRLELQAENFARFAMFTDRWTAGCYTTGEIVRGRAHSNQSWQSSSGSPGPVYTDTVSAVTTVTGTAQYPSPGHRFRSAPVIPFPSIATLSFMPGFAAAANLSYTPPARVGSTGGARIEFVAVDLDGDGFLTGPAEGYFRIFEARTGTTNNPWTATGSALAPFVTGGTDTSFVRADPTNGSRFDLIVNGSNSIDKSVVLNQCGVFYMMGNPARPMFMPLVAHDTLDLRYKWFIDTLSVPVLGRPGTRAAAVNYLKNFIAARTTRGNNMAALLKTGNAYTTGSARGFPAGDPYLMPVHRTQNPNTKGVIYVNGSVYLGGVFRGRATRYVSGNVALVDDLTYVTNPASLPICQNLLGIITGNSIMIVDNAINRPRFLDGTAQSNGRFLDDNQDFFLHAVTRSGVGGSSTSTFGVENLSSGPNVGRLCTPVPPYSAQTSGGCSRGLRG